MMESSNEVIVQYLKETYNVCNVQVPLPLCVSTLRLPHVMFQTRPSLLLTVHMPNGNLVEKPRNEATLYMYV